MKSYLMLAAASALFAVPSGGEILLHIDSATNQFWFTGEDDGYALSATEDETEYNNTISWRTEWMPGTFRWQSLTDAFSTNDTGANAVITITDGGCVILTFGWASASQITDVLSLVADPTKVFDYISFSSDITGTEFETYFEAADGQTLALEIGSGFANVTVVPEPSTYAAFASLGVLGIAALRKRARA